MIWQCGRFQLDLQQPKIMGIVNLTPDSFSDGGTYSTTLKTSLQHAEQLLKDGADLLDIGGESTRPGAEPVDTVTELARIKPLLQELVKWQVPITVDTRRTSVMRVILADGLADAINDIYALRDDGAVELLQQYPTIGICLMHMQGKPRFMQQAPAYTNVVTEVTDFLQARVADCMEHKIVRNRLLVDLGFGFGKNLAHNTALFKAQAEIIAKIKLPMLLGVSRKSMFAGITAEQQANQRDIESVTAAIGACQLGVKVLRVHNVLAHKKALAVMQALYPI